MPIPIRKYNIRKTSEYNLKLKEEAENAAQKGQSNITMRDMIDKTGGVKDLMKPDYITPPSKSAKKS